MSKSAVSQAPAALNTTMGATVLDCHAAEAAGAIPLPSPTLTNPEMILPFSRPDALSSRSPSPPLMYPHVSHATIDSQGSGHHQKALRQSNNLARQISSSPLSRSPGNSADASSVKSDDLESLNWSRFDGATETGSDIDEDEEDEERFGAFPQAADDGNDRWDTPQQGSDSVEDDEFSSAALSRRADIILANAKKRLSLMEGNLRGARSSLVSPTGSFAALHSHLQPQERKVASSLGFSSQLRHQPSLFSPTTHSRMSSESNMAKSGLTATSRKGPLRASSAMAFTLSAAPDSRGFALRESRSQEQMLLKRWNSVNDRSFFASTPESRESSDLDSVPENLPLTAVPQRSASTTVDIREQMNDLKSRISKLQERAREDGLKRRSFQSLQAPSPFTSAPDLWCSGSEIADKENASIASNPKKAAGAHVSADSVVPQLADSEVKTRGDQISELESHYEDAAEGLETTAPMPEIGASDEDAILNGYETADGESVYEDAYSTTQPERHEDRADAFDYEHFFLHSAMGTITHTTRRSSVSSNDSVETTRPASPALPPADPGLHKRMPSVESISTEASFVTAIDGADSDDGDAVERVESALEGAWSAQTFLDSSPTLGTADSARTSEVPVQIPLDSSSPSISMLSHLGTIRLDDTDKALIGTLEDSLRMVCEQLNAVRDSVYDKREWRRRLDTARRALQGELL